MERSFLPFLLKFSLGLMILGTAPVWAQESTHDERLPSRGLCAHRGAMVLYPENTLPAFRAAVRLGVAMIEMDARMTRDSVIVILHDATLDRTTDGSGPLRTHTLAEIKRLDAGSWKDPAFAGTRIPTLEEALAVIPAGIWINVHVKEGSEVSRRVARIIARSGRLHQAFIACDTAAAHAAREVSPEMLICNMERQTSTRDYVELTLQTHSDFIQFFRTPPGDSLASWCRQLKERGIRINYYRADDAPTVRKLWDLGVDFVLVNDPAAIMKALRKTASADIP